MTVSHVVIALIVIAFIAAFLLRHVFLHLMRLRRAEFIRTYVWPPGLLERLEAHRPGLERKDSALVSRGLRQFFIAYLMSGRRFVSMPSQVADDLWHEFILYTRDYDNFCRRAFGAFMHHTPAVVLGTERRNNEGLRRVWWYCCKYESINPYNPTRLPLLFALDAKLNIPGGFTYHPNCEALRKDGSGGDAFCGGDFSNSSFDGGTAGLGDVSSDGDSAGAHSGADVSSGDSSSGDSGSCGGGGDSGGGCGGGGD